MKSLHLALTRSGGAILPKERDTRLVTIRRGGVLTDSDRHLLALGRHHARSTFCTSLNWLVQRIRDREHPIRAARDLVNHSSQQTT